MKHETNGHCVSELNKADLARLAELHGPRLLAMLERRIDPKLDGRLGAEAILQDAWVRARQRWPPPPNMEHYPWLYRVALDCLIDAWRHENRRGAELERQMPWPEHSAAEFASILVDTATTPSQAFARRELIEIVNRALAQLAEDDRQILWMRSVDELAYGEVAQVLEIAVPAAAKRHARALQRLAKLLPRGLGTSG